MQKAVRDGNYDAGFAADGDGDRIGAVDRDGTFITPHQVFSILLWHLAGTRKLTGDLAKTFSTTKLLDKIAARFGRRVHEVPIGFKYICELMLERDILLGGEESGGIGTKLYLPERDATVVALLLAEVMAWHRKSLGELVANCTPNLASTTTAGWISSCAPDKKSAPSSISARARLTGCWTGPSCAAKISTALSCISVTAPNTGWVMIRASGTEHMLRIYSETAHAQTTQKVLQHVVSLVQNL